MNNEEAEIRDQGAGSSPAAPVTAARAAISGKVKQFTGMLVHDVEVLAQDLRPAGAADSGAGNSSEADADVAGSGLKSSGAGTAGVGGAAIFFKAFHGLILRDLRVLTREFHVFLLRVGMQPLLFLFVFTFILPRMGGGNPLGTSGKVDFGTILLPGLMAVAIMFSGIAAVALPLSSEFGITREIDDRVMCPLPLWAVALEKVWFSAMQSMIAALLVIPMAYYIPAVPVRAEVQNWFLFGLVLVLASLLAGSLGLVIGSTVNPKQIGLVFSIIVVPITFLGCVYYPWAWLKPMPWLQYGVLFNPIVFMSEGLRAAVTPGVAHMPWWALLPALMLFTAGLGWWGLKGFLGRVLS